MLQSCVTCNGEDMKNIDGLLNYSRENNEITKKSLKLALIKLLKNYDFEDISVSKLCNVAGVSRMSFYRNYKISNDILRDIAMDFNNDIVKNFGSPFKGNVSLDWYLNTFKKIYLNKEDHHIFVQKKFQEEWMNVVTNLASIDNFNSNDIYYKTLIWCGGFENIVTNWIRNGMQDKIEVISNYCLKYLPNMSDK